MRIGIFATAMELREYVRARDVHARVSSLHTYTRTHTSNRGRGRTGTSCEHVAYGRTYGLEEKCMRKSKVTRTHRRGSRRGR